MENPGTRAPLLYTVGRALLLCAVALGVALPAPAHGARGAAAPDALHVLRVSPADATADAPRATPIVVFFDRPMVPLTALETPPASAPVRLDPPLPGQGRWLNTATWAWSPPLHGATRYTVTVPAGLRALDGTALAALRLELTESAIMGDAARALDVLTRLHRLGVRLSVDDFGAGYSSLAYLKRLPVDELKIDRSFVRSLAEDETDATLVASIIGLGHGLGLTVVAEGMENAEALALLERLGCDVAQGYHVSRPLAADDLA
jgi:hypothetical protein